MSSNTIDTPFPLSAAILAGGEGRRMGKTDKSCLEISGEKLVSRIIRKIEGIFTETFIITRTPENHQDLNVRLEGDLYEERSSLTGIHAALYHAKTDHVFITACDSPFLCPGLIQELLSNLSADDDVLIPVHPDGMYEPLCAVYSKRCLPFIEQNLQNKIFQIIRFFPQIKVRTVDTSLLKAKDTNFETFINVNTPEELKQACKKAGPASTKSTDNHKILRSAALKLLSEQFNPASETQISVSQCSGYVAASSVYSEINLPGNDRSAMDGFAVSSADTLAASPNSPIILNFSGEVRPSALSPGKAEKSNAVRVLTGGLIPSGTDAIIPFEKVQISKDSIQISAPIKTGDYIRKAGSDIQKGEIIVSQNTLISPCQAALLAYAGMQLAKVRSRPSIAVLAVGNELCDPAEENKYGLIPADNLILLKSLCEKHAVENVDISPCENSPEAIRAAITEKSHCEIIITTGGTGPGNRDFVFNSVVNAGGSPIFKGLAMHPAKSIFACRLADSAVIGLPGPPSAVNLAFHTVIRPLINIFLGLADVAPQHSAVLTENVKGSHGRERLRPCLLSEKDGCIYADPLSSKQLSQRKIMNISNGVIVLPPDRSEFKAGKLVSVIKYN